jgi:threonine/homoserine/homoserine lactone efflux protein
MLRTLLAFVPVAIVVTITPGPATAMVVRSAARGGRRQALSCTVGNSIGVLSWALLAAAGLAAVVAASAEVFTAVKLAGAAVLVVLGIQSLRDGLVTSLSNPSSRCSTWRSSRSSCRPARRSCRPRCSWR